jgi:hypothetical protein
VIPSASATEHEQRVRGKVFSVTIHGTRPKCRAKISARIRARSAWPRKSPVPGFCQSCAQCG